MPTGGWWDTVPTSTTGPMYGGFYWSVIPPWPMYPPPSWWQQPYCPCPNCTRPGLPYFTITCSSNTTPSP